MKTKIVYIERKFLEFVSIEKVFRQIAESLSVEKFQYTFEQLKFGNNLSGLIKNLVSYSKPSADIYHITGHIHYLALKFPKERTVLTIHDLGFLHNRKGLRRYFLKKILLDLPVRKLKYITVISKATKDEIIFYTNCDVNKIRIIENPLFSNFGKKRKSRKKEFNKNCPTILQIGTSPNKNVTRLIEAVKDIKCKLNIVGRLDDEQKDLLKKFDVNFENSFDLNDDEMLDKYEKADIVAFCSTYEGFGLPIIEAQATSTPIISSNISPLKEVAGNGALLVDPKSSEEMHRGILRIIEDVNYRADLVNKGLENIKRFDSKKIAEQYEKLYQEILLNL